MDAIRLATPEEVAAIADTSDLTATSGIVTFGGKDFAVIRQCWEIDPMYFHPDSNPRRRYLFGRSLENTLRLQGAQEYYFNVPVSDEKYIKALETWGAFPTSYSPELRFKKVL